MSSRRFHRKSRSGCTHCKKRHIKCDEGRPNCANCQRASVVCTYDQLKVPSSPAQSASQSPNGSTASTLVFDHSPTFDMLDLSLMHYYTVSTSLGIFAGQGSREIWQELVPNEAQSNPLLMHGVLALASMDLARTRPNERQIYATRALAHQNAGTRLFRTMLEQGRTSDTHHVLMIFSMMLAILAFAFPHACDDPPDFDGILDLFSLVRGCKTVWLLNPESLAGTSLGQWVKATFAGQPIEMKPEVDRRFQILRARLKDPADILATDQLLDFIHRELATSAGGVTNIGRWPTMVSDAFWIRVQNHEVDSLLVLAHYSVVLGAPNSRWWTANWDSILLQAIDKTLSQVDKKITEWDFSAMMKFANSYKES
ncbi:unnamed protein product [Aureobasidium uvarum]|uniref:Zn(2)-C6 fungal-type domain-containing protein n=1 Tax=Aureobasidium uvarum TaxID=2773716 RepID=A0A9N8PRB3_9PEZI|nr:unnamed protein product [Aureobasidium uvarum]